MVGREFAWTGEQSAAIQALGNTLLSASAGTGKTTTVIGKILWRLGLDVGIDGATGEPIAPCPAEHRVTLSYVAAITFTEKAAYDLKKQLRQEIEQRAPALRWEIDRASVGTIHAFCAELLREHALRLGIDPAFRVLDEREARLELDEIVRDVVMQAIAGGDEDVAALVQRYRLDGWTRTSGTVDYVRDMLRDLRWHEDRYAAWCRDGALDLSALQRLCREWDAPDDLPVSQCAALHRLGLAARDRWERFQHDEGVRDFDSLILDTRRLLLSPGGEPALRSIRRRLRLLIIDEFQDTDGAQRDLAFAIAGIGGAGAELLGRERPQLFMVGDPKQSIYGFRGADITVWNEVKDTLCVGGRPLELTANFRSDPAVVAFVNAVCEPVMTEVGKRVAESAGGGRVAYSALRPARKPRGTAEVEWLVADGRADDRRAREAEMVAARIRDIVVDEDKGDLAGALIVDPGTGAPRQCRYRDVAVLFRSRTGLDHYERALQRCGIPYYLAGDAGLTGRQEILDLLTVLELIDNPRDDLSAFAYLRSPFVGLRDEVIARIRLGARGGTLLRQARRYLEEGEWFPAPEHEGIADIEREALAAGLDVIEELSAQRSRVAVDRLLEEALDRTGYRLHLLLMEQPEARLANVERLLTLLQGYRHHTVGTFLEIWDRWASQDLGIPQAPLYSKDDDVVTLSTIHSAKGLEWPVVCLVDVEGGFSDKRSNQLWSDRELGPVLCPKQSDRGPRTKKLWERADAESQAEEARLLYVASTRARDRLVVAGPRRKPKGVAAWLCGGVMQGNGGTAVRVTADVPEVEIPPLPPEPALAWIDDVGPGAALPPFVGDLPMPPLRPVRSATELMTRHRSLEEWRLRYERGVIAVWRFAPRDTRGATVPPWVRGQIIHGVLEHIEDEAEVAELLEVTIGAVDATGLEEHLAPGAEYRRRLEEEIARVVASEEWKWYVEGDHFRELQFVHLRTPGKWRVGAFDLFRPEADKGWIIDFKTHGISAARAPQTAARYALQSAAYRAAARELTGVEPRVRFHFTGPGVVVEG